MAVRIVPATREQWPALERVMSTPGDPEVCWCQVFRVPRADWDARPVERNRTDLERLVAEARVPGLVALDGDDGIGWCSVAPLSEMVRVATSPFFVEAREPGEDLSGRWVVNCFVVREEARGSGLIASLLAAAVQHARERGADAVEGFPLDVEAADDVGPDELFAGTLGEFLAQGFTVRAALGNARVLVVREL